MTLYWRSLDELENSSEFQEFVEREFPQAASEVPAGTSRRRWLQIMGASIAFAGVSGCRWQDEKITPFVERPDGRIPGVPQKYATSLTRSGYAIPILATMYDGRPTKLDANPDHPGGATGTDSFTQASILNLYDPDRVARTEEGDLLTRTYDPADEAVLRVGKKGSRKAATWDEFAKASSAKLKKVSLGASVRVLSEAVASPSLARARDEFLLKFPEAKWVEFEPVGRDTEIAGLQQAYGKRLRPQYDVEQADVIVCFDADLLGSHPASASNTKAWASRRTPENGTMNRLYAVESQFSTTGTVADHRLALPSGKIAHFIKSVISEVEDLLSDGGGKHEHEDYGEKLLHAIAEDLVEHKGKGLVAVGAHHAPIVHAAVANLNELLGNVGHAVQYTEETTGDTSHEGVVGLVKEIQAGSVDTLFVLGGNPVYNTPADVDFAASLEKVKFSVHLSEYDNETSLTCSWHVPKANDLECWGDGLSFDGTYCVQQPLLEPLHKGKSATEFTLMLTGRSKIDALQFVRETASKRLGRSVSEREWRKAVHDGYVAKSATKKVSPKIADDVVAEIQEWVASKSEDQVEEAADGESLELVFTAGDAVFDGRYANNGWLQEAPGALTKVVWDNVAIFSPKTADKLKLKHGDVVELAYRERTLTIPAYILPGQAAGSVGLALGYGRTAAGLVGGSVIDLEADSKNDCEPVGSDAYRLRTSDAPGFSSGLKVRKTGERYPLATTQDHWAIDTTGRTEISGTTNAEGHVENARALDLVREGTLAEYEKHSDFAQHRTHVPPLKSLWEERDYKDGYQWGMAIDLSKCVGCNACTVACQSENNIPVVGRDQVRRNREMHWLRIDRYFVGSDPETAAVTTQPVTCHHCENAPCEQVCPVAATVHSDEGLNDMAYNRCIGTRYCGNNCPYKVRRFNYLSYAEDGTNPDFYTPKYNPPTELVQLTFNPEVSIRTRGVMEKCTYCVQRIQNTKITAKNEKRFVQDGEIQTACQEACPANAIEFGNVADSQSKVSKAHANDRAYAMLAELNVKPRTRYLARIRNPHPSLEPEYYLQPQEHHGGHGEHDEHDGHGEKGHDEKGHGEKDHGHQDQEHKKHDEKADDHKKTDSAEKHEKETV